MPSLAYTLTLCYLCFTAPAKGRKSEAAAANTPATTPAREESRASTPAGIMPHHLYCFYENYIPML